MTRQKEAAGSYQGVSDMVSFRRDWIESVIGSLADPLPPGRIGDVVFLLRDQLRDKLNATPAPSPAANVQDVAGEFAGFRHHHDAMMELKNAEIAQLRAQVEQLDQYAEHVAECSVFDKHKRFCDCGLNDLRAQLSSTSHPQASEGRSDG